MKTKVKISIISATTAIIVATIGIVNYNIGEDDSIQSNENTSSININIDNNYIPDPDFESNLTEEDPLKEFITESYDINKLEQSFFMEVKVRNNTNNDTAWNDNVKVEVGDRIEFQIEYKNTGEYNQENVTIFNTVPPNSKYIEGTAKKYNAEYPNGDKINSDELFSEDGFDVGNYKPDTNVFIRFTIEVIDVNLVEGSRTLINKTRFQVGTEEQTISRNYARNIIYGWGPKRDTYTNEEPARHAVFNSITNNAAVGDERDFVRIAEKDGISTYSSDILVEAGKQYEVFIYFHNDASSTYNDEEHDYVGIAANVRVSSFFPLSMVKGEKASVVGRISSTNTDPELIWDSALITAQEDITLHYVTGSAKIYNQWEASGSILSTNLFSNKGTFIGMDELDGVIFGCEKFSGLIVYTIQTQAVEEQTK